VKISLPQKVEINFILICLSVPGLFRKLGKCKTTISQGNLLFLSTSHICSRIFKRRVSGNTLGPRLPLCTNVKRKRA